MSLISTWNMWEVSVGGWIVGDVLGMCGRCVGEMWERCRAYVGEVSSNTSEVVRSIPRERSVSSSAVCW